jgi:hypothetical protein
MLPLRNNVNKLFCWNRNSATHPWTENIRSTGHEERLDFRKEVLEVVKASSLLDLLPDLCHCEFARIKPVYSGLHNASLNRRVA